jgi:pyridoxine 5-phosphate synthase
MREEKMPRLGVNIDHVATLRQLRGTPYPSLLEAARCVEAAGGDQITVHLREDRRHIQDEDVKMLRAELKIPLNLEMAVTPEMQKFAIKLKPDWSCLVPEKRNEVTTEGGLDVKKNAKKIAPLIAALKKAGIKVSLFVEPSLEAIEWSSKLGADAVELHTGKYCIVTQSKESKAKAQKVKTEFERISKASFLALKKGLHVHAGHGFDFENVRPIAALERPGPERLPLIEEFNIGHSIVCRAAIVGMERAVREMIASLRAP